jgi:hypothetical protein
MWLAAFTAAIGMGETSANGAAETRHVEFLLTLPVTVASIGF